MAISTQLIDRLTMLTQQRKLAWEALGIDTFRASAGNTELRVHSNWPDVSLSIYDENGNLLDRESEMEGGKTTQLYEAARRLALNVEGKLAALEHSLKTLEEL